MRHLLSVDDLGRPAIESLLSRAAELAAGAAPHQHVGTAGLLFFEESLRTRVGFDVAAARLGLHTTTVRSGKHTERMSSAERFEDVARTVGAWCEVLCVRHEDSDAPARAAVVAGCPVVSCGAGTDEHPTEALFDLQAIRAAREEIDGVRVALVGDLRHARAAHSLLGALARFDDVAVRCCSPAPLRMPERWLEPFGSRAVETDTVDLRDVDVVYVAGFAPQTPVGEFGEEQRRPFSIDAWVVQGVPTSAIILCPLPRIDELNPVVDGAPQARYWERSAAALWMRCAVLESVLERGG